MTFPVSFKVLDIIKLILLVADIHCVLFLAAATQFHHRDGLKV